MRRFVHADGQQKDDELDKDVYVLQVHRALFGC